MTKLRIATVLVLVGVVCMLAFIVSGVNELNGF